jgi:rfaE bifunctional protein kinase chain/domain/rfaE bifunctional protein nucleotidyltransferase chain/domain
VNSELQATPREIAERILETGTLVTVIGDVMLDAWWRGRLDQTDSESPSAVFSVSGRDSMPGGAANTAMNLAALGARVRLVGVVGMDSEGKRLREHLDNAGVDTRWLLADALVHTATRNRITSGDQILLRIDEGETALLTPTLTSRLASAVEAATDGADAEIISDHGSSLGAAVRPALTRRRSRPPLSVVDAHDLRLWASIRPDLVTPNADEFARAIGIDLADTPSLEDTVVVSMDALLQATGAGAAVVTLGWEGAIALIPDQAPHHALASPAPDPHATGAGDTFVAALTLAKACGVSLQNAAEFAQVAADVVVGRADTAVCSSADLVARLSQPSNPSVSIEELERRLAADRAAGRRIVLTNGRFDMVHRGHIASLRQASQLGDVLVVALDDDDSLGRLMGPDRPVNSAHDRATILASLEFVDHVITVDADTPIPLLERLRPDIYATGGDYAAAMLDESATVVAYGGEVRILDHVSPRPSVLWSESAQR